MIPPYNADILSKINQDVSEIRNELEKKQPIEHEWIDVDEEQYRRCTKAWVEFWSTLRKESLKK